MTQQLKIILGSTTTDVHVYVGDEPIGLIQDLKIHAHVNNEVPSVEIIFPDLISFKGDSNGMKEKLINQLKLLKELPHVKVVLKPLDFGRP